MEAEGRVKEPMAPIMGRVVGVGGSPGAIKETWTTGDVEMMVWIVVVS
jgi:hypothetical protein